MQSSICKTTSKRSFTFWAEADRSDGVGCEQLIRARPGLMTGNTESLGAIRSARDAAFRARIAAATEWIDLELLFRTLTALRAKPLILGMPIDSALYEAKGVSRSARQVYYDRVSELAERYHFPLIQFQDHDTDPAFLIAHREHPTPKGWMYYDQALDDFFHKTK
jgi:poly-D-alanine transfer protein DltD